MGVLQQVKYDGEYSIKVISLIFKISSLSMKCPVYEMSYL